MDITKQITLGELVRKGKSQTLEFKKSLSIQGEGLEALCAMANSDLSRGMVVYGIKADGTVCGIEQGNMDTAQSLLSQAIRNKF